MQSTAEKQSKGPLVSGFNPNFLDKDSPEREGQAERRPYSGGRGNSRGGPNYRGSRPYQYDRGTRGSRGRGRGSYASQVREGDEDSADAKP